MDAEDLTQGDCEMSEDEQIATDRVNDEKEVYLPHYPLKKGEILTADLSTYVSLHKFTTEWPCLSLDIFQKHGSLRKEYPLEIYFASGTQASQYNHNYVYILKCSNICKTQRGESDDEDEDQDNEENANLNLLKIPAEGCINRVKVRSSYQNNLIAAWCDTGKVLIYNANSALEKLTSINHSSLSQEIFKLPCSSMNTNGVEGYGLAWSNFNEDTPSLAVGNLNGEIIVSNVSPSMSTPSVFYKIPDAHTSPVEDIEWSTVEEHLFISASSDKTIKVWDTRINPSIAQLSIRAHDSDVNTISWNKCDKHLLVSGADDGCIKVWDIRTWPQLKQDFNLEVSPICAYEFKWHKKPITCVEWMPNEASSFTASGSDNQITVWDLLATSEEKTTYDEIPPQLMFIHQGQEDIKEVHWHPNLKGVLMSTALDGINIFETINSGA